jgi:hypothetical protein
MASISINPATLCIGLVCGVGENDVLFTAPAIYKAWKDWFVTDDNSKYLPAFDSAGGDPVGASSLDNVYFLLTENGWKICPITTETDVRITIDGNLFPDLSGARMFDPSLAAGHTHIETVVSTSARQIETGTSGLTSGEAAQLNAVSAAVITLQALVDEIHRIHGLKPGEPMTVTPTSRVSGSIAQVISGDGATTTTVTRT